MTQGASSTLNLNVQINFGGVATFTAVTTPDTGTTAEATSPECTQAASDEVCYDSLTLEPGTYGWKVVAEDGDKLTTISGEKTFTAQ